MSARWSLAPCPKDDGEAGAGELHAAREVEDAELLADLHVVGDRVGGILPLAHEAHHLVGGGVGAGGDLRRGKVRDHEQRLAQVGLHLGELAVDLRNAIADGAHLGLGGRDVAAGLGDGSDLLRGGVALRLEGFRLAQERTALRVEVAGLRHGLLLHAAPRQLRGGVFEIFPDLLDVNHGSALCFSLP